MNDFTIEKLNPSMLALWLDFFDTRAFADNPDWASCYCRCYHFDHSTGEWQQSTAEENRFCSSKMIEEKKMGGYIALKEGKIVGWCNVNDKKAYARLEQQEDDDFMLAITCFVIDPLYRQKGIAKSLLEKIIADARTEGYQSIEAEPPKNSDSPYHNYKGPLKMYKQKGFEEIKDLGDRVRLRLVL